MVMERGACSSLGWRSAPVLGSVGCQDRGHSSLGDQRVSPGSSTYGFWGWSGAIYSSLWTYWNGNFKTYLKGLLWGVNETHYQRLSLVPSTQYTLNKWVQFSWLWLGRCGPPSLLKAQFGGRIITSSLGCFRWEQLSLLWALDRSCHLLLAATCHCAVFILCYKFSYSTVRSWRKELVSDLFFSS